MLQTVLVAPFLAALAVYVTGFTRSMAIGAALLGSLITLALAIGLFANYNGAPLSSGTYDVAAPWVNELGINFHLAVDGLGVLFVLLTSIVTPVAVLVTAYTPVEDRLPSYLRC